MVFFSDICDKTINIKSETKHLQRLPLFNMKISVDFHPNIEHTMVA